MTAPCAEGGRRAAFLVGLLAGLLASAGAVAQVGPPTPLVPAPTPGAVAPVSAGALPRVDDESVGLLDEAAGGLGADLWAGIDRATLVRLLAVLPVATPSPTANDLARRLLLSAAKAPPPMAGLAPGALIRARAERLLAAGDGAAAAALIRQAGFEDALARLTVDALLDAPDPAPACARLRAPAAPVDEAYFQKARVFCQIVAGDRNAARIGRDLLAETGAPGDAAFLALSEVLLEGGGGTAPALPRATALDRAMLRAAKLAPPADLGQDGDPANLRLLAQVPGARRLAAAEAAERIGALGPADLARAYDAETFTAAETAAWANAPAGPRGRALRFAAARQAAAPALRGAILAAALGAGGQGADRAAQARLYVKAGLVPLPQPETLAHAAAAARAHLAAGGLDVARAWNGLLAAAAVAGNGEAQGVRARLRPLLFLAGDADAQLSPDDLAAWTEAARQAAGDAFPAHAATLYALLAGAGVAIDAALWRPLIGAEPPASAALATPLWHALEAAAWQGRRGEALVLALAALDRDDPRRTHPVVLGRVMEALRAVGREAEARALALEAALAAGL